MPAEVLLDAKIAISMDGKGAWRDNVFVERLWRTVKYEEVYLRAYDSVSEARASIAKYLAFYNQGRPHSSLDGRTPDEVAELTGLIEQSGLFGLPPSIGRPNPDGYAYELIARLGRRSKVIEFFEGSIPAEVQPLLAQLKRLMVVDEAEE